MSTEAMKVKAIAPWFGCNRILAKHAGEELNGCKFVGVPFCGAMPELAYITASTIVVSDLHWHVVNLASVIACPVKGPGLYRRLRRAVFCPQTLSEAQKQCRRIESSACNPLGDAEAAYWYFIAIWMGRSAKAGTDGEFSGKLPVRWSASGGDSNTRYRSAVRSITAWRRILARCNFVVMDCFDFLEKMKDQPGHGLYVDPPFPNTGDSYKHKFNQAKHVALAHRLSKLRHCRVVCRFYDHALIRGLYTQSKGWHWRYLEGRKQTNDSAPEVLIINGPSYTT